MPLPFSSRLPLSRYEVDRDHVGRERDDLWESLWADPATRVLIVAEGAALLAEPGRLALRPVHEVPEGRLRVYLGRSTSETAAEPVGTPLVVVELEDALGVEGEWANLRMLGHELSDRDAGILTEALGILNWHDSHRYSPRTGNPTVPEKGGWVRRDPESGLEVFPRTDPAVIVGVVDDRERLLLGRNALWESNRYSLLAGFVEPGESLESAVAREVHEESGIVVVDPVYLGSQPWPFPASLMLGFTARAVDSDRTPRPDGVEILDVRWFEREELAAAARSGELRLPGPTSIARAIIEEWFGDELHDGSR